MHCTRIGFWLLPQTDPLQGSMGSKVLTLANTRLLKSRMFSAAGPRWEENGSLPTYDFRRLKLAAFEQRGGGLIGNGGSVMLLTLQPVGKLPRRRDEEPGERAGREASLRRCPERLRPPCLQLIWRLQKRDCRGGALHQSA